MSGTVNKPGRDNFFNALPPEVREMIFGFCDLAIDDFEDYEGIRIRHPYDRALVTALRPQPSAYQQVLSMFFKQNRFQLDEGNSWNFSCMTSITRSFITKLTIKLPGSDEYAQGLQQVESPRVIYRKYRYVKLLPSSFNEACKDLPNLREVKLYTEEQPSIHSVNSVAFPAWLPLPMDIFPVAFPAWLRCFNKLSKLEVVFPIFYLSRRRFTQACAIQESRKIVDHCSQQVGVSGKLASYPSGIHPTLVYEWLAPKGETMDWSCVRMKGCDSVIWNFWEVDAALEEENGVFRVTK